MNSKAWVSLLVVFLITVIWASGFSVIRHLVDSVPPVFYLLMRFALATVIVACALAVYQRGELFKAQRSKNARRGVLLGAILAIAFYAQAIGIASTNAVIGAFVTSLIFVAVPLLEYGLGLRSFSLLLFLTLSSGCVGLYVLFGIDLSSLYERGVLWLLLSVVALAIHLLLASILVTQEHFLTVLFWQCLGACVCSVVMFVLLIPAEWLFGLTTSTWLAIGYMAFFASILAYMGQLWSQKHLSPLLIALVFAIEPLLASLIEVELLSEAEWGSRIKLGASFVMIAVLFGIVLEYRARNLANVSRNEA